MSANQLFELIDTEKKNIISINALIKGLKQFLQLWILKKIIFRFIAFLNDLVLKILQKKSF